MYVDRDVIEDRIGCHLDRSPMGGVDRSPGSRLRGDLSTRSARSEKEISEMNNRKMARRKVIRGLALIYSLPVIAYLVFKSSGIDLYEVLQFIKEEAGWPHYLVSALIPLYFGLSRIFGTDLIKDKHFALIDKTLIVLGSSAWRLGFGALTAILYAYINNHHVSILMRVLISAV